MKHLYFLFSFFLLQLNLSSQITFTIQSTICKNDTTYLSANVGSLTNCSYTWMSIPTGANLSTPNNSVTSISFFNSGTYTVFLTVVSGTNNISVQNTVAAFPLLTITLTQSSFTTCITTNFPKFSKPVHLSANSCLSYTWTPGPSQNLNGGANGPLNDVRPTANACFSVIGIDANGCKARAATCITVIPRFSITVTPASTLMCKATLDQGFYSELVAGNPSSPSFGLPTTHYYYWIGSPIGSILSPVTSATIDVSPQVNSTYTIEMLDSANCVSLPAFATVNVENCLGVSNISISGMNFKFYPNPVKDKLSLSFVALSNSNNHFFIYNTLGQLLSDGKLEQDTELEFSHLSAGVYYLKILLDAEKRNIKIIKE